MNQVRLKGRVEKINQYVSATGSKVISFSLSTLEKDKAGNWTKVYHRIVCFGRVADEAKGELAEEKVVHVEGKIKYGKFIQKDGAPRHTTDIVAFKVSEKCPWEERAEIVS